jgi:hypothetical protein
LFGWVEAKGRKQMREIAAFAVAALILVGVGSIGKSNVSTVREAAAATEAGLTIEEVPVASAGVDAFGLMANARGLPTSHHDDYSMVFN